MPMMEPKPTASLSAGLLARKGSAQPAMRRPYIAGGHAPMMPASVQDDLGWNDMGDDAPTVMPSLVTIKGAARGAASLAHGRATPPADAVPPVKAQQEEIAESFTKLELVMNADPADVAATVRARPGKAKAAFTLRLDPDRHLRLRLACAISNRSAQQIVTAALDAFLDRQPQVDALARQIPSPSQGD